jgi:8-oxo-dGTP diphosphatase
MLRLIMNRKLQTDELFYKYCPTCKSKLLFKIIENRQILGCPHCSFLFWNNPRPVVSALIVQNGNVLLIKRKSTVYNGYWALPGGIINYLEEPEDALTREVFEEAKVHVNDSKLIDAYLIVYGPNGLDKKPSHTSIDLIYHCKIQEVISNIKKVRNNSEIEKIGIFPINKLPKLIAFKHREIINKHS